MPRRRWPLRRRARVRAALAANLAAYCRDNDIDLLARILADPDADSDSVTPPGRWEGARLRLVDLRDQLHYHRARLRMSVRWWCTPPARRREIERAAEAQLSRLPPI
ncbi:hypothetical protein NX801_30445 [Streptomyces sp. LP05-1]|uniref:Uncharacterized protein n=1 Tax=Streptomyces pyxinae TaxID=2970734 RepID=A0ABT2CR15_9ACTN|nr:hypothetical protein [Streptomyces sp. LP05-1]MCS0639879.1 hypothetical protein [Streptomyces sp. LP05-1]